MITLAFDSTAKVASAAVAEDGKILAQYNIDNGLTQSELLLPMAESILASLKLTVDDIGLLACSVGPGSFTGVRIGVALVKGLAFSKNIPCASVSALDALAENLADMEGIIVPCMDARRSQVYTAVYRAHGGTLERLTPDRAIAISELESELREKYSDDDIYFVGDGYRTVMHIMNTDGLRVKKTPSLLIYQNAASVARTAEKMYERGECTSDIGLAPTYLRLPQAERERLERIAAEEKQSENPQ